VESGQCQAVAVLAAEMVASMDTMEFLQAVMKTAEPIPEFEGMAKGF